MATQFQRITPFLWFDDKAEEAAAFYTSVFRNSKVLSTTRYTEASANAAGRPKGSVMTVAFQLDGQEFTAINGGPTFKFTEAVSFVVNCDSQAEIDYFWNKLSSGGDENAQMCGWLKDKFGLSWQVVPTTMLQLLSDPKKGEKVMAAVLRMKKLDLAKLEEAAEK